MNKHIIWVKAKCDNYYKLISKLQYLNIPILEIKYEKKIIYLKIEKRYLPKLEKYLVSYKFKKEFELGIFNVINKIKRNHIFIIALAFGVIFYLFLINIIVRIDIVHESMEIRELLKDELKSRGIKVLTLKKSYEEITRIKEEILDEYPDKIDWLEIEKKGMVYIVRIEERIITNIDNQTKTCDIVAKKNGTISNIKLFDGEVKVDLNDYVREGDVLISGNILHNEEIKRSVCASGEVYATVWYTVNITIPFDYAEYERTGKRKYNIVWQNENNKKKIFKDRFKNYDSKYKPILKIFDFTLFLESEYETNKISRKYSEEEAVEMALIKAEESVKKKLSDKDNIIDKKVLKKSVFDSTIDVEIFVIVEELIGVEKITVNEEKIGVE